MVFGFGNSQQTVWDKVDMAVEELLTAARKYFSFCAGSF
jgi:hypothetical protein